MRAKRNSWTPVAASLFLFLGACISFGNEGSRVPADAAGLANAADAPLEPSQTSSPTVTPEAAGSRVPRPLRPALPPVRLVGLQGSDLVVLLGPPDLTRRDPPAEVWRYAGSVCVLHVFFYQSPATKAYEVMHVDANRARGGRMPADDCLADLVLENENGDRAS